jgi:hypothetical protein
MKDVDRNMQRSSIFLTRAQIAEVQKVAKDDDRYPAEIIRYAVVEYLDRRMAQQKLAGQK